MTSRSREHRHAGAVWFVIVALVLALSSTLLPAQDGQEELTFEELQEQREAAAQRIANAAATIDVTTATIDELATAIDEIDALASIHQLRLQEAIDRYDSALDRLSHAEELQQEVLAEIDVLRVLVADLALAQFTGETGREPFEIVLSTDPGESARLPLQLSLLWFFRAQPVQSHDRHRRVLHVHSWNIEVGCGHQTEPDLYHPPSDRVEHQHYQRQIKAALHARVLLFYCLAVSSGLSLCSAAVDLQKYSVQMCHEMSASANF